MAFNRLLLATMAAVLAGLSGTDARAAYLYWKSPDFTGAPVRGDEPGIGLAMPGADAKELRAHLVWNMRAGLNVAALNCQFEPTLMAVRNYNDLLRQHGRELTAAYSTISAYFKRTGGKTWQKQLDQYTTKTYNGFSPNHAQIGFCETAGSIAREALTRRKDELYLTAVARMQEFRNSLVPKQDRLFAYRAVLPPRRLPTMAAQCWDRKGRYNVKKCGMPTG